jgi:hypothetical protein
VNTDTTEKPESIEDMRTRLDIYQSWHFDDVRRIELLEQHLRAVIEVARTWQPDYATKMDRDTLRYARECVGVPEGDAP